jgi:hypothetical protein|tara:strand:+ start:733 stop:1416 length:684 start_codon:yes stop_codon:yes gene_type:complete
MARINQYPLDGSIDKTDLLIGSDNGGTTKNYQVSDIGKAISKFNMAGQPQICYRYNKGNNLTGNLSIVGETNATKVFTSITTVIVSKFAFGDTNTSENILLNMVGQEITITDIDNPNNFGAYTLDSATVLPSDNNFYTLALFNTGGAGNIVYEQFYVMTSKKGDLSFVHEQTNASNTWVVNHNLGKKPSVTIVTTTDTTVIGEITYNNQNKLTINLSSANSGKAYLN